MKKTARNDVTGDWLQSKPNNEQFEKNWDLIFGKKKKEELPIDKEWDQMKPVGKEFDCNTACGHYECNDHQGECKRLNKLPEYELNKSTGEVQKVDNGDTTNTQK